MIEILGHPRRFRGTQHVAGIAVRIGHLFDHRIFGRSVVRIAESGKLAVWSPEACIERAGMRIDRAGESIADRRRVDRRDMVGFRKGIGQHFPVRIEMRLEIRSEEHTSELQSLMRTSYAVFCLKKKKKENRKN